MKKILFAILIVIVAGLIGVSIAFANGGGNQGTCPNTNGWIKIDSGDLSIYPVPGATAYCFKAGPFLTDHIPQGGFGQEGACEAEHIERCGLSHWSYFKGEIPQREYWGESNCYDYAFYLFDGETVFQQGGGSWFDTEKDVVCLDDVCVERDPNFPCKPCVREKVFYWSDGWCSIRQRGGPIGGQTRPFLPMQNLYCGCDYAHDEGWEGFYAVSDCKGEGEEYTFWNELPQFCGISCPGAIE
jgi:hypothetical protein